jgi:hypothetical protein
MNASPINWKLSLIRSSIAATLIITGVTLAFGFCSSSRVWGRYLGAITISADGLLIIISLIGFSAHRKTAILGLAVAVLTIIIGLLFPEL